MADPSHHGRYRHSKDSQDRDAAQAIAAMRAVGAEVRAFACDVADKRALARAFAVIEGVVGPVAGVFHLAGVAGDGMLAVRDPKLAAEVLRPKALGTYALAEVLRGRASVDFVMMSSSRAAHEGLVGGGDYAAANAVLDAAAGCSGLFPGRVLSIGFPAWSEVGMAARGPEAPTSSIDPDARAWTTTLSQQETWGHSMSTGSPACRSSRAPRTLT